MVENICSKCKFNARLQWEGRDFRWNQGLLCNLGGLYSTSVTRGYLLCGAEQAPHKGEWPRKPGYINSGKEPDEV